MTLLTALRCSDGIVLTTDSREASGTPSGRVGEDVTKLWKVRSDFLVAWAGYKNVAQAFYLAMQRDRGLLPSLDRVAVERRLLEILRLIRDDGKTDYAEWLIAWWCKPENTPVALKLSCTGTTVWAEEWERAGDDRAIDISTQIAAALRFVPRDTLTVEQAKVLALKVMRDTLRVGVDSIGGEPQVGAVTRSRIEIVAGADLRGLHDTLGVWEERMAALLPGGVEVPAHSKTPDRGVRPPGDPSAAA